MATGVALVGPVVKRSMLKITRDHGIQKPSIPWIERAEPMTKHAPPGVTRVVAPGMMTN